MNNKTLCRSRSVIAAIKQSTSLRNINKDLLDNALTIAKHTMQIDKEALMSRATTLFKPVVTEPVPAATPTAPAVTVPVVEPAAQVAPAVAPTEAPAADQSEKALNKLVGDWMSAWMSKD